MGFLAPALVSHRKISREACLDLFGLAIETLTRGPSDGRFGRKVVIIGAILRFGLMRLASLRPVGRGSSTILRFLTGLESLAPRSQSAATPITEYVLKRCRSIMSRRVN